MELHVDVDLGFDDRHVEWSAITTPNHSTVGPLKEFPPIRKLDTTSLTPESPWLRRISSWGSSPTRADSPNVESSTITDGRAKSILSQRLSTDDIRSIIQPRRLSYTGSQRNECNRNQIIAIFSMSAIILTIMTWIYNTVCFSLEDGKWWRVVQFVILPATIGFIMFPVMMCGHILLNMFGSIKFHTQNSTYYGIKPILPSGTLPHVTIQMPVYKESLDDVIKPTLGSLYESGEHYRMNGGSYNIFINDDGLQLVSDGERLARIAYYSTLGAGYVARPPEGRAGRFKKASNLNFCIEFSRKTFAQLIQENDIVDPITRMVRQYDSQGTKVIAGSELHQLQIGDIILIVDADTRIPIDCIKHTVYEFVCDNRLGYTQHHTTPLKASYNYWEDFISFFTSQIFLGISIGTASGDPSPLIGHNVFMNRVALESVAFDDGKWWSEDNVSEDFDMSLRLNINGYYGRYITYTGPGFIEGVSLCYSDEIIKFRRYSYGACEIMFNRFFDWWGNGVFTKKIKTYILSGTIPWASKFSMVGYLFTYFAMSTAVIIVPINYVCVHMSSNWNREVSSMYGVSLQIIFLFGVISPLSGAIFQYRRGGKEGLHLLPLLWEYYKYSLHFALLFGSLPIPIFESMCVYFLGLNTNFGATQKDLLSTEWTNEVKLALYQHKNSLIICITQVIMMVVMYIFCGWCDINGVVPMSMFCASHLMAPFLLNPRIMRFDY